MSTWKVGDPVVVDHGKYGVNHTTVTKVARKYFTVATESWYQAAEFEIATGHERVKDSNYPQHYSDRAYTPQQWETKQYRDALTRRIREDHGVWDQSLRRSTMQLSNFTDGELLELVEFLDRVKERLDQKDLDR